MIGARYSGVLVIAGTVAHLSRPSPHLIQSALVRLLHVPMEDAGWCPTSPPSPCRFIILPLW